MGRVLTNNTSLAYAHHQSGSFTELQSRAAVQRLAASGQPADTDTVDIDGKTYTFQTTLTDSDGNVLIGSDDEESISNLVAAINLDAGAGTAYAASTTEHPTVGASKGTGASMVVTADTAGDAGNSIAVATSSANLSWDDSTLQGGGDPVWKLLEPNEIPSYGADITTVARDPISKNRQRRAGTITDLDSSVEVDADWIIEHFLDFAEGFVFAQWSEPLALDKPNDGLEATATGFSYNPIAQSALAENTLVFVRGFDTDANNGLHVVGASSTDAFVDVAAAEAETLGDTSGATLEVAGVRGAAGDLEIDASGDLISTTLDFTTLGLVVGQFIHVGGEATANRFFNEENFGRARITNIEANKLTLDKKTSTFVQDDGTDTGSGGTALEIDIHFGRFLRNVSVDDADFLERAFMFEAAWDNLGDSGADEYEYAEGNYCNELSLELPLTDKATMSVAFVGTDTEPPTTSRKAGASTQVQPQQTEAFNTSADILRLRITEVDETGLTTDFKQATVTLNNNVSPEKVLGQLGAKFMNTGTFMVDLDGQVLFTDSAVPDAIRNNRTVTMDFLVENNDGGIMVDIPSMKLGGGDKELPVNESVLLNLTGTAFIDSSLGTSIGISLFPFLPAA